VYDSPRPGTSGFGAVCNETDGALLGFTEIYTTEFAFMALNPATGTAKCWGSYYEGGLCNETEAFWTRCLKGTPATSSVTTFTQASTTTFTETSATTLTSIASSDLPPEEPLSPTDHDSKDSDQSRIASASVHQVVSSTLPNAVGLALCVLGAGSTGACCVVAWLLRVRVPVRSLAHAGDRSGLGPQWELNDISSSALPFATLPDSTMQ